MDSQRYSTADAAQKLQLGKSTVNLYIQKAALPVTPKGGKIKLTADDLLTLEKVKQMRLDDSGWDTIQRHIGTAKPQTEHGQPEPSHEQLQTESQTPMVHPQIAIDEMIERAITKSGGLAEKYAIAARQIGQLESENKYQSDKIAELQGQLALLPAPGEVEQLQAELERTKQALAESKTELEVEKKKSWWQKLFG